ncbi:MAG TPA: hypothetical protein VF553_14840 [Pyrinomonadaceae bacterium]|jgi:hypothetical protein
MNVRRIIPGGVLWALVLLLLFLLASALAAKAQSGQQTTQTPASDAAAPGNAMAEREARRAQARQLALDGKYGEAYALGKQALLEEPGDLRTLLVVSWSGLFMATGGTQVNSAELTVYAQKALRLIHEGMSPDASRPLQPETKEQILGWLEYALGIFTLKSAPEEAIGYLTLAAQSEGFQKYDPQTYALLAMAYEETQYAKLSADYRKRFKTPKQRGTREGQAAMARIVPVINRLIDAYARAVALSGDNPAYAKKKPEWKNLLTEFYKFLHGGSDVGVDELVAAVLSKPLGTLMDSPIAATRPVATVAAAAQPESSRQAATSATMAQAATPQRSPQTATPARVTGNAGTSAGVATNNVPASNVPRSTASAAVGSSPAPKPSPRQPAPGTSSTPAPKAVASSVASSPGLDPMFYSTWSYYLAISTSNGNSVSHVAGTIKFSDKGSSFNQDLRIPSAQTSFAYKYQGTFSIQGNKLSLIYRDAQGATKTEVYDFLYSPELKALRLTRDYGRSTTTWILFLKGTENVSRCTEQGKAVLSDVICRQAGKAG